MTYNNSLADASNCSALTVLHAPERRLVKAFARDDTGRVVKLDYDGAALFHTYRARFNGIDGFAEVLRKLQGEPELCVIPGAPGKWHPGEGDEHRVRRLLHPALWELADDDTHRTGRFRKPEGTVEEAAAIAEGRLRWATVLPMFEDRPAGWLLLDFERIESPELGKAWRSDLPAAVEFLRGQLPPEFHNAACVYYPTASAADLTKPDLGGADIRMRLGFLLSHPITGAAAKQWLKGTKGLDPSTLGAVQATYTAAPLFFGGLSDPLPDRACRALRGAVERVSVPDGILALPAAQSALRAFYGPCASAVGLGLLPSPGLDAALAELAEADGAAGEVRSTLLQAAAAYARDVGRERVDFAALEEALAEAASPYRDAAVIAGYNLPALIAWAVEHTPDAAPAPTAPHFPAQGLPADEASERLRAAVAGFFGAIAAGEDPGVVGIKGGAGLGKTGAFLKALATMPGAEKLNIAVYMPTHDLAEELAERARKDAPNLRALAIRGRTADGPNGAPMCAKSDLAARAGAAGDGVGHMLCRRTRDDGTEETCPFFQGCAYQAQFRDAGPALRIFAHAALFAPPNPALPEPHLVVIDESFWRGGIGHDTLPLEWLGSAGVVDQGDVGGRVLAAFRDGRDPRSVATAEECRWMAGQWRKVRDGLPVTPAMDAGKQRAALKDWQGGRRRRLALFWELLAAEHEHLERPIQRIVLAEGRLHLHYRKGLSLPAGVPVLLLDADLNATIAAKFFPGLQVVEIPVRQRARVVQVADKPGSKRFLLGGGENDAGRAGRRLAELEAALPRLAGANGLVVAPKAVHERLSLPEGTATAHFGALRGLDTFKGCDAAVIVGREEPGPRVVEDQARALFGDEAEPLAFIAPDERGAVRYAEERRCYRMVDGTAGPAVGVSVHPDPRCQAVLEQIRECELSQAVGRLRLVHRDTPATVYLLTNIPIDLDVTETTTWHALTRDRAATALRRWGGVWLLSPSERSRCAPDLWPTAGAAKQDERRGNKGTDPSKEYSFEHRVPLFAPPPPAATVALVEYRFPSQRGRHPHRAYVPVGQRDEAAVRLALEAITGPVAKLTVHCPAEPSQNYTENCVELNNDNSLIYMDFPCADEDAASFVEHLRTPGVPLFRVLFADVLSAA